jgi:LmbE family N-acetylglucosaminyl deacetylase
LILDVLAIGANSDDIILGCGGMLIKAARLGHTIRLCTVTRSSTSSSHYANKDVHAQEELNRFAKLIKASDDGIMSANFPEGSLSVSSELISFLESCIDKANPDMVLTHFRDDIHHDRQAIAMATEEAGRFSSNILNYETPTTRNFDPKVYYDITDVIDDKTVLLLDSTTERAIKALAGFRALQSRFDTPIRYVEAFEVVKVCVDKEFKLQKVPYEKVEARRSVPLPEPVVAAPATVLLQKK